MSRTFLLTVIVLATASSGAFAQLDPVALRYNPANRHTYALTPPGMSWQAARAYSRTLGGYLVAINDLSEQTYIQTQYGGAGAQPLWIGLSDHETEGVWKWDSGEPVLYANFCANEPNNFGGVEDYVEIFPAYAGGPPCWNDDQSPYTGTGIAPTQAIIELPYGSRVDFDYVPPISISCVSSLPTPLGATTDPEGVSWNGATLGQPENPFLCSIPEEGMPVSGTQYLRIPAWGIRSVPFGGPLLRPVPPGIQEVRIAIPAGTKGVSFAWEFIKKHSGGTVNDGADISVVDGAGALIAHVAYADFATPLSPSGSAQTICGVTPGIHTMPVGPAIVSAALPPLPDPAYLSIVVWNGEAGNIYPSSVHIDAIQFWGEGAFRLKLTSPFGPGSIRLQNLGGGPGSSYWTAVTLDQGSFPFGWLFGVDIPPAQLIQQVGLGAPFSGTLDAGGNSTFTLPSGVPPGLQVYAVSLQFEGPGPIGSSFLGASAPKHFVTP